jgi:lysophospholipase L1-like esterase
LLASGCGGGGDDGTARATPVRWVSAGDSFASGVGLRDAAGDCSTSQRAYGLSAEAALHDVLPVVSFTHLACTGARIADVSGQLERAPAQTNLVTMDAGGNDIGFFKIGSDCVGADDVVNRGCDVTLDELQTRIDGIRDDLTALYKQASGLVGDDGLVVVVDYPQLIEDPQQWPANVGASCGALHAADVETLRKVTTLLDETIRDVANKVDNVEVLDVRDAFAGHGRCGPETPWLNGFSVRVSATPFRGSFHPNADGYAAIAALLEARLRDRYKGS